MSLLISISAITLMSIISISLHDFFFIVYATLKIFFDAPSVKYLLATCSNRLQLKHFMPFDFNRQSAELCADKSQFKHFPFCCNPKPCLGYFFLRMSMCYFAFFCISFFMLSYTVNFRLNFWIVVAPQIILLFTDLSSIRLNDVFYFTHSISDFVHSVHVSIICLICLFLTLLQLFRNTVNV